MIIRESVNFERGGDPIKSLKIGRNRNNFFATLESIPYEEYFIGDTLSENTRLLKAAAKLLQIPPKKVRIASKEGKPLSYFEIEKILDSREWTYERGSLYKRI